MIATTNAPNAPAAFPTSYRDKLGRVWRVKITAGLLGRLRREADVDLGRLTRTDANLVRGLGRLLDNQEQLGRFLWVLTADQADARGVGPEDFIAGFDGPTLDRTVSAIVAALAEFSPRSAVAAAAYLELARADGVAG